VPQSHGIVTYHLGTNFWGKKLGCLAFLTDKTVHCSRPAPSTTFLVNPSQSSDSHKTCDTQREKEMERQGKRRLRVVLVPWPFQGHINPMLQLGSILHSNGFSITVVHAQYSPPDPSSHPDFSFLSLPDTSSDYNVLTGDALDFVLQLNAKCKARSRECLAEVMRQQGSDNGIACIIYDEYMFLSEETAKDLNLPSIILRTSTASNFLARTALIQLKTEGHIPFPGIYIITPS